jgi:hypothetical protein
MLGRNDGEKLSFIGNVQGIEAQEFAGASHGITDRKLFLE